MRSALALLVDRAGIQGEIMGRQGETTGNFLNRRPFASPNTKWEFDPDKANAVLDAAGWKRGADGIDRLWRAAETEMDPVKRAAMFIRMNDLVVQNVVVIPVVIRHAVFATGSSIRGFDFSPFSGPLWRIVYWTKEA